MQAFPGLHLSCLSSAIYKDAFPVNLASLLTTGRLGSVAWRELPLLRWQFYPPGWGEACGWGLHLTTSASATAQGKKTSASVLSACKFSFNFTSCGHILPHQDYNCDIKYKDSSSKQLCCEVGLCSAHLIAFYTLTWEMPTPWERQLSEDLGYMTELGLCRYGFRTFKCLASRSPRDVQNPVKVVVSGLPLTSIQLSLTSMWAKHFTIKSAGCTFKKKN